MRRLVALDIPPSTAFVDALSRCHDAGDAVLPLDHRLSRTAAQRLVDALAPSVVLDGDGEEHLVSGGIEVADGDAFVLATSGSTGTPKGVVLTHEAVAASARAVNARLSVDPSTDRWLSCLPFAHVGGLSVLCRALASKVPIEIQSDFDADAVVRAQERGGATLVSLVATALWRLGPAANAFRTIVLGGSAPPSALGDNVVTTYGMTETGSGVVYDGLPLDGVELRLVDGEIQLRAPMLLRCYRDGRDPKDAKGWFATGDGGALDDDGRLVVHGRLGELVVSGGENVWPVAVEAILAELDGVAEVAVGGLPDPEWGERVVAYVVAAPGAELALEELRAPVREALGPWAAPKELVLVESLPRTTLGKIRRAELARTARTEEQP